MQRRRERAKRMMIDSSEITTRETRDRERDRERILDSPFSTLLLESYASLLLHSSSSGLPGIGWRETLCKSSPSIHQPAALASFANLVVGGLPSISLPPSFSLSFPSFLGWSFYFCILRFYELLSGRDDPLRVSPMENAANLSGWTLHPVRPSFLFFISFYIPPPSLPPQSLFSQQRGPVVSRPIFFSFFLFLVVYFFPPPFLLFSPSNRFLRSLSSFHLLHSSPPQPRVNFCERAASLFGLGKGGAERERERSRVSLCSLARLTDKISFVDEQSPDE